MFYPVDFFLSIICRHMECSLKSCVCTALSFRNSAISISEGQITERYLVHIDKTKKSVQFSKILRFSKQFKAIKNFKSKEFSELLRRNSEKTIK